MDPTVVRSSQIFNPIKIVSFYHVQSPVCKVILDFIKLTFDTNVSMDASTCLQWTKLGTPGLFHNSKLHPATSTLVDTTLQRHWVRWWQHLREPNGCVVSNNGLWGCIHCRIHRWDHQEFPLYCECSPAARQVKAKAAPMSGNLHESLW